MSYNTKSIKKDVDSKPIPQYFNETVDDYEVLKGRNGASFVEILGPNGETLSIVNNKLAVRATEIESLLNTLNAKDFATATKQDLIKTVLDTLAAKDYSTETTLAALKALFDSGDAKMQLNGSIVEHNLVTNDTIAAGAKKSYTFNFMQDIGYPTTKFGFRLQKEGSTNVKLTIRAKNNGTSEQSDTIEITNLASGSSYPTVKAINIYAPELVFVVEETGGSNDITGLKLDVWAFVGGGN